MRKSIRFGLAALFVLCISALALLSGCSSSPETPTPIPTATPAPTFTPLPTSTPEPPTPTPLTGASLDEEYYHISYEIWNEALGLDFTNLATNLDDALTSPTAQDTVQAAINDIQHRCAEILSTKVPPSYSNVGDLMSSFCKDMAQGGSSLQSGIENLDLNALQEAERLIRSATTDLDLAREMEKKVYENLQR